MLSSPSNTLAGSPAHRVQYLLLDILSYSHVDSGLEVSLMTRQQIETEYEDKQQFPELKGRRTIKLYQRDDGFVCEVR